ncbi:MAG: hypothetical protein EXR85_05670 [Xanthomonadales bacterium]|nr:hypothetical protein [Xanthomonadales bacterium]
MSSSSVAEFFETLRGKNVFFDALHGNHGDRLLSLAAQSLLDSAPFTLAPNLHSADFILINGGGSMADGWFGLERLTRYCTKFPSHPLAVLPSSFYLTKSNLKELIGTRQAPLWLWARERTSLGVLQGAGLGDNVHLQLDHDLAFSLAQHPMIEGLHRTPIQHGVLVIERDDWEGPTGRTRPLAPPGLDFIPERVRTLIRKTVLGPIRRRQDSTSKFAQAAVRFVHGRHFEATALPPHVADISLAETCSFAEFLTHVAAARVIVTTRLHVAILGHLLQRRTYLVDGRYHKFRGVFDYSMQGGSTELLAWDGQELVFAT